MKLVKQQHTKDCGVACVAMLAGVSYELAKQTIFGTERAGLTDATQLKAALIALNKKPAARFLRVVGDGYRRIPGAALLKVNPLASGEWHWVVWTGSELLDPKSPPYTLSRLRPVSYLRVD